MLYYILGPLYAELPAGESKNRTPRFKTPQNLQTKPAQLLKKFIIIHKYLSWLNVKTLGMTQLMLFQHATLKTFPNNYH